MTIKVHFDGNVFVPDEPVDLPAGADAVVQRSDSNCRYLTARELLNSGVVGIWADREDISDNVEFARQLRDRAQRREI